MTYIYSKVINGKSYYYLRMDKREKDKKVIKDIAYLGNDLSKINIDKLLDNSKYKKEIRKSYKVINKYINSNYYLDKAKSEKLHKDKYLTYEQQILLESIRLHFKDRFLKLDRNTQREIYDNFVVSFTYNTTSIEGNTIPLSDVRKILFDDKIQLKNKTLREIYDLRNTKDTFFSIVESKKPINIDFIINTHKQLVKDVDERIGFRKHDVRVIKSRFDSAPYFRIEKEIQELINWYKENKKLNPFILATIFHHKFEKIHPFADGNGRTGRLLMNYILIKNNYPPIIITKKNRDKYLEALESADKSEEYSKLLQFLLEEYKIGYWENFVV
ncbi:MAG: Fic family protein [archaeon]